MTLATWAALARPWQVGDRARSRSGGWEGRVVALERGGKRASLETGGVRVQLETADLEPALGPTDAPRSGRGSAPDPAITSNVAALRLARARTVPSSLDLRGARVDEALEALDRYLDDAGLAGLDAVTVIHGLGTGALRDATRTAAAAHPLVEEVRPGGRGEGGDGATVVRLGAPTARLGRADRR